MQKRNILFITHSNNDLDHFLPLFIEFKKDKNKEITALAFYHKNDLLKNRLHSYICKENSVELESYTDMFGFKWLSHFMTKLYIYSFARVQKVQYIGSFIKKLKNRMKNLFSSPRASLIRLMYYISKKYIVLYTIFFMTDKRIEKYFKKKKIDLVIIDLRTYDEEDLTLPPLKKMKKTMNLEINTIDDIMFRFLTVARKNNIPLLSIPHGPNYASEEPLYMIATEYKKPFRPDYSIHCSLNQQQTDTLMLGIKKDLLLGDPRFDPAWIDYVEKCALELYKGQVQKPRDKKVLLYLGSYITRHSFRIDPAYHQQLHKDILSLVNDFPEIEIWLKFHPRLVYKVPIEEYIIPERQQNIRFFGNETDTNVLTALSDMVVSPESSTLTIPVLHKKPLIYYYRWKEKTGTVRITTVFDECPFILKAANHEELKTQLDAVLRKGGYHVTDADVALFYKKMFSVDSPYDNMTKKYMDFIEDILEKKI